MNETHLDGDLHALDLVGKETDYSQGKRRGEVDEEVGPAARGPGDRQPK